MTAEANKGKRGCLFYGCLGGSIIVLLVIVGILVGMRYAKKMFSDFTDAAPAPLPASQMDQAEVRKLQNRVDLYREDVRYGRTEEPLALTDEEINALIHHDSDLAPLKDKIYVTIQSNQLQGQLSVPLDQVGLDIFKGRYLNGTAHLDLVLNNGRLRLIARDVTVKGKPVPDIYQDVIQKYNFGEHFNNDPRANTAMDRLEKVEIRDGKLQITPRKP